MRNKKPKIQRQRRIRSKVQGTNERPRLSVFRSNIAFSAQIINDEAGKTLIGFSQKQLGKQEAKKTKTEVAKAFGIFLAQKAQEKKIKKVVFDKGSYTYHGRVKAFADGAREGGLQF